MSLRVSSFQSLGTKDGPGIRYVIFTAGCPLRCAWCHNPETHSASAGDNYSNADLLQRVLRCRDYFGSDGGVTISGGEPLLQAKALTELLELFRSNGIHIALDTSGADLTPDVRRCLELADLVMLSIKGFSDNEYQQNTERAYFTQTVAFLEYLDRLKKPVRLRYLLVPDLTDSPQHLKQLAVLEREHSCVKEVELLRFRKLCIEKYRELDLPFRLIDTPEADAALLERCQQYYNSIR